MRGVSVVVLWCCGAWRQLLGRTIRVDHKLDYKPPKDEEDRAKIKQGELPEVKFMPKNARGHGDDGTTGPGPLGTRQPPTVLRFVTWSSAATPTSKLDCLLLAATVCV